ncbi:MAG: hypothetical protein IKV74_04960, partial [Clostridia bacterium]|nr:hypothetical protein [Clostridia bacterium]
LVIFLAITIVFASVAVSMIVTSFTRRLQADGHRIGMLRAVDVYSYTYGNNFLPLTRIERTVLGNDAGIIGAAMIN